MFTKSARFYDAIYSFKDYAAEARMITEWIRARAPGAESLLDVACGTGVHIQYWESDFRCEGIDLDPELLSVARDRNPDVPFHVGNMEHFDLGKKFDAVTCMFSSIGYTQSRDRLNNAVRTMAEHVAPGGVLVVEPWFTPELYEEGHLGAVFVDEPDLKIARMNVTELEDGLCKMTFHYLVGTPDGFSYFTEDHTMGLFSHEQYLDAFRLAGLAVDHDPSGGPMGRGLYVGVKPAR
jgi:ubiquinone/menaquinone biosynthesis C-methylase UbiE